MDPPGRVVDKAADLMMRASDRLGLNPAARVALAAPQPTGDGRFGDLIS